MSRQILNLRCLSKRKDTNFKANHNDKHVPFWPRSDVCLSAKIRILKQITTMLTAEFSEALMFV